MTNEPSPRPWHTANFINGIDDANNGKVAANIRDADAALIVAAVNERDRLHGIVRRLLDAVDALYTVAAPGTIVRKLTPDRMCLGVPIGKIVAEARAAIGEDGKE